ncbi:polymer-forming cytoskeletal protein [Providencia sp. JGM181]|nr:polymer-forming cytoskeletal protein [Providencia alcalifaciens]MBS0923203.1 polymer-forming cytoskeletal protein [Providencia sp. JGM181]MBS0931976.1 polymer-forming cytoskeletal protein [Providencia sp. JGM172]MBS0996169.1 polymer-forming cytoskeletal protein [Providencia sp. JGM178]MTC23497.1 polymer-forming cytoskeletal protein [Providencia sp. wls1938]MTC43235.1 polymer-forming cytoskeletal protein [Providencia sp. wls1921]MTC45439.1 polymer-forming cytoskeletal protein [Providencia s
MKKTYLFLNISFFFWFLTLIAWFFRYTIVASVAFISSIICLVLYFNYKKVSRMFNKKQSKPEPTPTINKEEIMQQIAEEKMQVSSPMISEEKTNTIIAKDVVFEGNITSNEQVHIYGTVIGNIAGKNNTVKIMQNGQVTGNITSNELWVNGKVEGECISETISIDTNGEIYGTIRYSNLSIKKGGIFSGLAEVKSAVKSEGNVAVFKEKSKQGKPEAQTPDVGSL